MPNANPSFFRPDPAASDDGAIAPRDAPALRADEVDSSWQHDGTTVLHSDRGTEVQEAWTDAAPLPHLPGYEVLEQLGRGGMGVVYKARQAGLNRIVALKMIRAGDLAGEQERRRFRAEAEAVARLQHPNVVQIFEVGEHQGRPFFSMEFVSGGSLEAWMAGTPQPPRRAAELVETLARTMQAVHRQGIVHRDLKPANVLMARQSDDVSDAPDGGAAGHGSQALEERPQRSIDSPQANGCSLTADGLLPKITDFGLARLQREGDAALTPTDMWMGTPRYMAPEQAWGKTRLQDIGPAADIYSLGVILYELLTGRPPYVGESAIDTLQLVLHQPPVAPSRLQPGVPRDLEIICLKCLHKQPERRYASAGELAEDLRRYVSGQPIQARAVGRAERAWMWCKRYPAVAGLLAALVVALVGVSFAWRESQLESRRAQRAEEQEIATRLAAEEGWQIYNNTYRLLGGHTTLELVKAQQPLADSRAERLKRQEAALTKASKELAPLADKHLDVPSIQTHLADIHASLAALALNAKRADVARSELKKSAAFLERAVQSSHGANGDPQRLADRFFVLAVVWMELQEHAAALEAFEQAAKYHRLALEAAPDDPPTRKALSVALFHCGEMQRRLGKLDDAVDTAQVRMKLWPTTPDEVYDVACEISRCLPLVKLDAGRTAEQVAALQDRYGALAVSVLREAVGMGLTDPRSMDSDTDLRPLQERADYQELLRGL